MICDFGEVVVVPFPFIDVPVAKRRPAVVLSVKDFNAENGQTILAMITTAARSTWPSDHAIGNLNAAGLAHACVVRGRLFTLPNELIVRRIGVLDADDRGPVHAAARRYIAPA